MSDIATTIQSGLGSLVVYSEYTVGLYFVRSVITVTVTTSIIRSITMGGAVRLIIAVVAFTISIRWIDH
jgi:hypothetical protein